MEKEFILCAALKFQETIVCGRRHSDCYETLNHFVVFYETNREDQGFLTSLGRFVDRKEAWKIAKANNQIKFGLAASENGEDSILISENLY